MWMSSSELSVVSDSADVPLEPGQPQRSISAAFISAADSGRDLEAAAREMLLACASHGIKPTASMHHNVRRAGTEPSGHTRTGLVSSTI